MPRASRYLLQGYTYHLTHRCTNRQFLLRFGRDREVYCEWLRIGVRRHHVPLYGYCVTSSHVHLVVHVDDVESVGGFMDLVAGATAQQYNRRKGRSGAFWEPYQCTIIEDGKHLLNCLRYVDLNMVRAGVVQHPDHWRWCGWSELTGRRRRYRLIDTERLLASLEIPDAKRLRGVYVEAVERALKEREFEREPIWTESLAVGSEGFVQQAAGQFRNRYRFELGQEESPLTGGSVWTVREGPAPYSDISEGKKST